MSSTLDTLRQYERMAQHDADLCDGAGAYLSKMYYDGKKDAYGVVIDMLEGDERREAVAAGKRWTE